jgi:hypothetical protein
MVQGAPLTPAIFVGGYLMLLAMGMGSNEHTMLNVRNIGRGQIRGYGRSGSYMIKIDMTKKKRKMYQY